MKLSKDYDPRVAEPKWQQYWEKEKVYAFDSKSKAAVFSVDTPPPTVSGKMHIGHAFSYAQQDFIVRFQRMRGRNVFCPFGTDDNGLPTERLVESLKKVRSSQMQRSKYRQLVLSALEEIRPQYIADWKRIGMSCDWDISYATINDHCQRISQQSFIELTEMGRTYRKDAPTMWCPSCHTAISQVECEDRELDSTFNDVAFRAEGKELIIATTRPELIPACVAVIYHPGDKRYEHLRGKKATVPLFDYEVPIFEDVKVEPEKGTGIVMCCTFGDQTDMEWQRQYNLPIKMAISPEGKMTHVAGSFEGMSINDARKAIIDSMRQEGLLKKQEHIKHTVNVHERCGTEIEFLKAKQWFIKYLDLKDDMLKWGKQLRWHPGHMRNRYENWVHGLQWDWLISRQRHYGVPFPVWYCKKCDEPVFAKRDMLPADPLKDRPPVGACPHCGCREFVPEKDILDTWATSSLTPQLAVQLVNDEKLRKRLFPMTLRPQAHDIITFWLFNTVVKSELHYKKLPWRDVMISGWALDPKGRKMSKSRGNIIEPQDLINKYGADALRFWAAGSKLGEDLPFQEKDLVTGRKLIVKMWNASKFTLMHIDDYRHREIGETGFRELETVDKWLLSRLMRIVKTSTEDFENYEYAKTKLESEKFFWHTFCDNYLEFVKGRMYGDDAAAKEQAQYTLYHALLAVLKLFAPIIPHITEELYQLRFAKDEGKKSIHVSDWPAYRKEWIDDEAEQAGDLLVLIISAARKFKSTAGKSLKTELKRMKYHSKDKDEQALLKIIEKDIKQIGIIEDMSTDDAQCKTAVTETLSLDFSFG